MKALEQLIRHAGTRHGLVTQSDLADLAISQPAFGRAARNGQFVKILPNVWRHAAVPPSWEQSVCAALLWLGPQAAASHTSAARLLGLEGFGRSTTIEISAPPWAPHRIKTEIVVHRTVRLDLADVNTVDGLRVTSATRTIVDLAASGARRAALESAVDSAVHAGLISPAYLARRLGEVRRSGLSGVRAVEGLLPDSGGHTRLERMFLALMRTNGLPRPNCQVARGANRVDFDFGGLVPLIVEVGGRRGHASDAERARDATRRTELRHAGYTVLEFTYEMVGYHGDDVVAMVRRDLSPLSQ